MVKSLYDTVKNNNKKIKFGISPQGNINANYNSQYADVKLWAGTEGYADYIIPQIYFGFENETCPFESTLKEWEKLVKDSGTSLIIGLAEYKLGEEDKTILFILFCLHCDKSLLLLALKASASNSVSVVG